MLYYSEIAKKKKYKFYILSRFFFNKKSNFLKKRMFILDTSTSDSIKKNCLTNFVTYMYRVTNSHAFHQITYLMQVEERCSVNYY